MLGVPPDEREGLGSISTASLASAALPGSVLAKLAAAARTIFLVVVSERRGLPSTYFCQFYESSTKAQKLFVNVDAFDATAGLPGVEKKGAVYQVFDAVIHTASGRTYAGSYRPVPTQPRGTAG